ncbi:probable ATP-dependent RNA helicase DDX10 [Bradysia coprophila]|uniref:probable ATP-dependent RNA helicase DDX10 n=1 Tax=Bradysia coprophila TaxID=38358 RepID=UPI00187DAFAD|nr:probable ATP-dependent RNA helicase DDX10 [Bradysia coprophila]
MGPPKLTKHKKVDGKSTNKSKKKFKQFRVQPKKGVKEDDEIKELKSRYESIDVGNITLFKDLPLSLKTVAGLKNGRYFKPTEIQRQAIGYALKGRDVLGAAVTGSGKTLAFLIPVMENLFLKKWSRTDGIGAIIISPTRELAYQIFETLKKVGVQHDFSAGLIIGGKNLKFERSRMDQCNIIICTPGRLLQHMDENPLFNCSSMQVLVLDEADRCLDMGFEETMNGIIENLPPERQTLLFSATQTKSVKDLARLSLSDPVYVAPIEQAAHSTPDTLQQNYVVVELEEKITMLWSFIKNHLKQKCIVFLSSCKQVKYIYEIFCKLRPGTSLIALYGTLHQDRRMAIYNEFCRKSNVVLFATDVASRGLDFPIVNWVVQLDCPEDATAYIHRAGRTARHKAKGENLLVLLPSEEEAMVEELKSRKIPINKIAIDPKKMFTPRAKMEAFLAANQELKESAQRAFVAYIKSVVLMKNKKIFNVEKLNTDEFARSLGLVVVPRIRFLARLQKHRQKNREKQLAQNGKLDAKGETSDSEDDDDDDDEEGEDDDADNASKSTVAGKDEILNFNVQSSDDDEDDDDDDFLTIKRKDHEIQIEQLPEVPPIEEVKSKSKVKTLTKAALAKRIVKKKILSNTKVQYDDDGSVIVDTAKELQSELAKEYENAEEGGIDIQKAKDLMREEDKFDKVRFRQMVKARHKEAKRKARAEENQPKDDFGSDDESDGPDLSWLPDYKPRESDSDSNAGHREVVNSSDESDDEEPVHRPPKRLLTRKDESGSEASESDDEPPPLKKTKNLTAKLSVDEAEQLAMQLLGSR